MCKRVQEWAKRYNAIQDKSISPYQSINGKIYENEHDEELSRRFGDKYGYIKYKYPEAYKLSEREIRDMTDIIREAKDMKEVEEQLEAYIKENGAKF